MAPLSSLLHRVVDERLCSREFVIKCCLYVTPVGLAIFSGHSKAGEFLGGGVLRFVFFIACLAVVPGRVQSIERPCSFRASCGLYSAQIRQNVPNLERRLILILLIHFAIHHLCCCRLQSQSALLGGVCVPALIGVWLPGDASSRLTGNYQAVPRLLLRAF